MLVAEQSTPKVATVAVLLGSPFEWLLVSLVVSQGIDAAASLGPASLEHVPLTVPPMPASPNNSSFVTASSKYYAVMCVIMVR